MGGKLRVWFHFLGKGGFLFGRFKRTKEGRFMVQNNSLTGADVKLALEKRLFSAKECTYIVFWHKTTTFIDAFLSQKSS